MQVKCKVEFGINKYGEAEIINVTKISTKDLIKLRYFIDRVLDTVIKCREVSK